MIDATKECESCLRPYSYIRARVTLYSPKRRDICLSCGAAEEKENELQEQKRRTELREAIPSSQPRKTEPAQQTSTSSQGGHSKRNLDSTVEGQGSVDGPAQRDAEVRFSTMEGTFGEQSLFNGLDADTRPLS